METTRLFDFLSYQAVEYPTHDALAYKHDGHWVPIGTVEIKEKVDKVSLGLIKKGIGKGDKIALISFNRPEWVILDLAIQQLGAISVPVYPTITEEDYRYIFKEAEVRLFFTDSKELYDKVSNAISEILSVEHIFTFDRVEGVSHWEEVASSADEADRIQLNSMKDAVRPEDLVTIIYTSGTTGNPKGVMLTHNNIVSNVKSCVNLLPVGPTSRVLSFLPLCHIFERMVTYVYIYAGASIYYAESMDTIGDNIREVKPTFFTCVPRLLEKVYDRIIAKGLELRGIKKRLFFWAVRLGLCFDPAVPGSWWYRKRLKIANKLIFSKWREALGGRVEGIVSGSAALQPRLARIFWAAGIPVLEGYGLTETSPVIAFNVKKPGGCRIGTVGPLIPGIEVKIAEDGEILTRGPHVMKGYYKQPSLTAEVLDAEGWFHTGDIGELQEGNFLKITDRKKEIFKTSGGKYIAPQIMENKFKESTLIEQIIVIGEGERFPAALIVPSFDNLKEWCTRKGIPYTTDEEMIKNSQILQKFQEETDKYNEGFAKYEKIKKFELLSHLWTIDAGELTPTLKLKRKTILEKNSLLIQEIYAI